MHVFYKTSIAFILLSLCSCIGKQQQPKLRLDKLDQHISTEKKKSKKNGRNQYQHLCHTALLSFYNKEYDNAAKYFELAHSWSENHYTKSTSKIALAKIINEKVSTFRGHYLERFQFRLLAGINYLCLSQKEAALIEFRRLSREIRLSEDPFGEKRSKESLQHYSALTGLFFALLKRPNEGKSDLKFSFNLNPETFPRYLKKEVKQWVVSKNSKPMKAFNKHGLIDNGKGIKLFIKLTNPRNTLVSKKISLTMFNYLPIIQTEVGDHKNYNEIEEILLGTLGKRIISISFPTPKTSSKMNNNDSDFLDFNKLYNKSWQLQKNRLIKTSIIRICLKLIAANAASKAIENKIDNNWGQLLSNIGRTLVWKTEKADLRVINYLPSLVNVKWEWVEEGNESIQVNWNDVF